MTSPLAAFRNQEVVGNNVYIIEARITEVNMNAEKQYLSLKTSVSCCGNENAE